MVNSGQRRTIDREVSRILKKIGLGQEKTTQEAKQFNFRWDYTLALLVTLGGFGIVIFPPQEPETLVIWLAIMEGMAIYPAMHFARWLFGPRLLSYVCAIVALILIFAAIGYAKFPPPNTEVHISQMGTLFIENNTTKLNIGIVNEHSSQVAIRTSSLFMVTTGSFSSSEEEEKVADQYWPQLRDKFERMKIASKTYSFSAEPRVPKWWTLTPEQPNLTDTQVKSLTAGDGQTTVFFMTIVNYGFDLGEFESCVSTQGVGKPTVSLNSSHNRSVRPRRPHWWSL